MKDTQFIDDSVPHSETYLAAVAKVEAAKKQREQRGYGTMAIASAMAGGYHEAGKAPRVVAAARMFCILFAFVVPNLLIIRYAF